MQTEVFRTRVDEEGDRTDYYTAIPTTDDILHQDFHHHLLCQNLRSENISEAGMGHLDLHLALGH